MIIPSVNRGAKAALGRRAIITLGSLAAFALSSGAVYANDLLYSVTQQSGQAGARIKIESTSSSSLPIGLSIDVPMPDGVLRSGEVIGEFDEAPLGADQLLEVTSTKVISLDDGAGSIELHMYNGEVNAMTIFDTAQQTYNRVVFDSSNTGVMTKLDPNDFVCVSMPVDNTPAQELTLNSEDIPSLTTVQNLQSKPGAPKVLYIDYWGGSITVAGNGSNVWNASYGDPLNYDVWTLDGSTAFSDTERYRMWQAWAEAAEDYAPFNVNVTTRTSVYAATATANRSRIIATTTATRNAYNICSSGCGGVAYKPSFGNNYYNTGFTFNSTLGSMGMTHSHEAGHQMGLNHDGTTTLGYYSGHGDWGPVMGAPFGKRYVQWSKGNYPNANQTENDFAIIDGKLGTLSDIEGGNSGTAYSLGTYFNSVRLSVPGGAVGAPSTAGDYDYYEFTVPAGGAQVDLTVAPELGVNTIQYAAGEDRAANLTMQGGLYKSPFSSYIVRMYEDDNTPMRPNTNKLEYSGHLDTGDYIFWVEGRSPNYSWTTGFDDWGTGGKYRVNLDVDKYPYASCGSITGENHSFTINNNGHNADVREFHVGSSLGGTQYYKAQWLNGDEHEHYVRNLPTDGSTLYVRVWSRIDGSWRRSDTTCTAYSSGTPRVYAPLPESILPTSDTFYWNTNGVPVTNYHLYVGNSLGGRQVHNSGDLGTVTNRYVDLPTHGKTVYVRLWYSLNNKSTWQYHDTTYQASDSGEHPVLLNPAPGAPLGAYQNIYWDVGTTPVDRFRVYAGPLYGTQDWTGTTNLPADTRSYEVGGWTSADYGKTVWVRLLWRNATTGIWSRSNHSFVAGFGPSLIEAEASATAPVEPPAED